MSYEVVAVDWCAPDVLRASHVSSAVVATFDGRPEAERCAERLDRLALRCYVRPTRSSLSTEKSPTEGGQQCQP